MAFYEKLNKKLQSKGFPMNRYIMHVDRYCNVERGYFFHVDQESEMAIGHLRSLSFPSAKISLKNDILVTNAEDPTIQEQVCGVLSYIQWNPESNLRLEGNISFQNKALLCEAISSSLSEITLSAEFVVYDYDYQQNKYFKHFYSEIPLQLIINRDSRFDLRHEKDPNMNATISFYFMFSALSPATNQIQKLTMSYRANGKHFIREIGDTASFDAQTEQNQESHLLC
jgi:hypothetical protein